MSKQANSPFHKIVSSNYGYLLLYSTQNKENYTKLKFFIKLISFFVRFALIISFNPLLASRKSRKYGTSDCTGTKR